MQVFITCLFSSRICEIYGHVAYSAYVKIPPRSNQSLKPQSLTYKNRRKEITKCYTFHMQLWLLPWGYLELPHTAYSSTYMFMLTSIATCTTLQVPRWGTQWLVDYLKLYTYHTPKEKNQADLLYACLKMWECGQTGPQHAPPNNLELVGRWWWCSFRFDTNNMSLVWWRFFVDVKQSTHMGPQASVLLVPDQNSEKWWGLNQVSI